MTPGKAYMIGRAKVDDPDDRPRFDQWYETDHLPLAVKVLRAERGWRFWCRNDPAIHFALYQFPDYATCEQRCTSHDIRFLIADFDKAWPKGVTRTREFIELVQEIRGEQA